MKYLVYPKKTSRLTALHFFCGNKKIKQSKDQTQMDLGGWKQPKWVAMMIDSIWTLAVFIAIKLHIW